MTFAIINNFKKDVHNLLLDVGSNRHKLTENAVQNRFKVIPLSGVLAVEQL